MCAVGNMKRTPGCYEHNLFYNTVKCDDRTAVRGRTDARAFDMWTRASQSSNVLDQGTQLGVLVKSPCCLVDIFFPHVHNMNLFSSLAWYVSSNYFRPKRRTGSFTPSSDVSRWWMSLSIPARSSTDSSFRLLTTATYDKQYIYTYR